MAPTKHCQVSVLAILKSKATLGSRLNTYNGVRTPRVPKTAKGYYYYHDKNIAITLPQFPFSKEGGEESPPLPRLTVGTGKAIPPSKLKVPEKYVSQNYSIS